LESSDLTPEDCGTVPTGSAVVRRVSLKNVSGENLHLKLLSKTCGCVSVKAEPDDLGPGQSSIVTLSTASAPLGGQQIHGAVFEAAHEVKPGEWSRVCTVETTFRYTPDLEFMVFPANRVVGHCVAGEPFDAVVYVNAAAVRKRPPSRLGTSSADVETVGVEEVPENPNVVKLRWRARPRSVGVFESGVSFETGSSRYPKVALPLIVFVRSPVDVEPPGAIVREVATPIMFTVRPKPGSSVDLSGLTAVSDEKAVSVELATAKDGESVKLTARINDDAARASGSCTIGLENRAGVKIAAIPVAWFPSTK
jgi:hypothetical protein